VFNEDAFIWLRKNKQLFDAVVIDFPDPSSFSIGKLYSSVFYQMLKKVIQPNGLIVVQSTSPYVAPKSFWCVDTTLRSVGFYTKPYHNMVPSFGEWGYIIASPGIRTDWFLSLPATLKYLNRETIQQMFIFPEDMKAHQTVQANKLNNQALVGYFEDEWGKYLE
jgi:spermidine synthase